MLKRWEDSEVVLMSVQGREEWLTRRDLASREWRASAGERDGRRDDGAGLRDEWDGRGYRLANSSKVFEAS